MNNQVIVADRLVSPGKIPVTFDTNFTDSLLRGFDVVVAVQRLIEAGGDKNDWQRIISHVPWQETNHATLRQVALMVHNHLLASEILFHIVPTNALHWKDFVQMARGWMNVNFHVTSLVMEKVHEISTYLGRKDDGLRLAGDIANSGPVCWYAHPAHRNP